jgi:hypothetical protein
MLVSHEVDILIWSKDAMATIKSIPEYYLGKNVEFLGEAWKNQGLG